MIFLTSQFDGRQNDCELQLPAGLIGPEAVLGRFVPADGINDALRTPRGIHRSGRRHTQQLRQ